MKRITWGKIAVITLLAAIAVFYAVGDIGDVEIIPIKNGVKVLESEERRQIHQNLIIVRAPSDPYVLKQTIERYDRENPLQDDGALDSREIGARRTVGKRTLYVRCFYRCSEDTPRDWNGELDEDKDARAAAHMQDRIAMIHWEEGDCGKNYFCYDLDRDDSSDDPGVFFYEDGSVKDSRNEVKQSEWVVEKRGDKYWVHMR